MNMREREEFRKSDKWMRFRARCKKRCNVDYITKKPLMRDWNLHHLDLSYDRYGDLSDMKKFLPLNEKTHLSLHKLYAMWKKDHDILKRIEEVMLKMEEYSGNI